ncbi:complement C1q-like protein 4 [Oncorhynchus keta]|uniref:complement C1q-like protein 4 n=1 Tax=Oncorhynchus keta TaxID=8018 RepID=UPI00227A52CC|nr:complement C1q-like protein 4 [Oncorhynchus keta]
MAPCSLPLLALACLSLLVTAQPTWGDQDIPSMFRQIMDTVAELQAKSDLTASVLAMKERMESMEKELQALKDIPKVAFAASLGGNGLQKAGDFNKKLVYREVLTNVGGAYNVETGEFTAPVRGVYYIRFTANAPTDVTLSSMLYKNGAKVILAAHESPSGEGSDTASNGATLLLEEGDSLQMMLWANTQVWDNANHHSTFSGFLLFPMPQQLKQ